MWEIWLYIQSSYSGSPWSGMSDFFLRWLKNKEALVFSPTFLFLDREFANFPLYSF